MFGVYVNTMGLTAVNEQDLLLFNQRWWKCKSPEIWSSVKWQILNYSSKLLQYCGAECSKDAKNELIRNFSAHWPFDLVQHFRRFEYSVLWAFICYVTPHTNTHTVYYKNNIFTIFCSMLQPGRSSAGVKGTKCKGRAVFIVWKQFLLLQNLIVVSKL